MIIKIKVKHFHLFKIIIKKTINNIDRLMVFKLFNVLKRQL